MKLSDYMNPEKFPRTSQKGLSASGQLRIDAFNLDAIREAIDQGKRLDEDQQARLRELQAKAPYMAELTKEVAAAARKAP